MTPCFVIDEIKTPKGYLLRGLWFGAKKPKRVVIWIHGLGGSAFGKLTIAEELAQKGTAVLVFNNRGHDIVSSISTEKGKRLLAGSAHEKFTDCVDDIQGAVDYVRKAGVKDIYLAGHSTGCQKSVYWAYKTKGKGVKGIILLAPVSDYAASVGKYGKTKLSNIAKEAERLVARGKGNEMLPEWLWEEHQDAQRFLSLNTPDALEELFLYSQPGKNPRILKSIKKPILVLWAEKDEYVYLPAQDIAAWFDKNITGKHRVVIISGVGHSFSAKGGSASGGKGGEREVAKTIRDFITP